MHLKRLRLVWGRVWELGGGLGACLIFLSSFLWLVIGWSLDVILRQAAVGGSSLVTDTPHVALLGTQCHWASAAGSAGRFRRFRRRWGRFRRRDLVSLGADEEQKYVEEQRQKGFSVAPWVISSKELM